MTAKKSQGFEVMHNVHEEITDQPPPNSWPYMFGSPVDFQSGAPQNHQIPVTSDQHPLIHLEPNQSIQHRPYTPNQISFQSGATQHHQIPVTSGQHSLHASPLMLQPQKPNQIQHEPNIPIPFDLLSTDPQVQPQSNVPHREMPIPQGEQHPLGVGYSRHQRPDCRNYGAYTSHQQMWHMERNFPPQGIIHPSQFYPVAHSMHPRPSYMWGQANEPWYVIQGFMCESTLSQLNNLPFLDSISFSFRYQGIHHMANAHQYSVGALPQVNKQIHLHSVA